MYINGCMNIHSCSWGCQHNNNNSKVTSTALHAGHIFPLLRDWVVPLGSVISPSPSDGVDVLLVVCWVGQYDESRN